MSVFPVHFGRTSETQIGAAPYLLLFITQTLECLVRGEGRCELVFDGARVTRVDVGDVDVVEF